MSENSTTTSSCEHVKILQKATFDWLIHDVIQQHPWASSGGFMVGTFLLFQILQKLRGK